MFAKTTITLPAVKLRSNCTGLYILFYFDDYRTQSADNLLFVNLFDLFACAINSFVSIEVNVCESMENTSNFVCD